MNDPQAEKAAVPKKSIFRPGALENYSQRQQQDVWPHLALPGYVPYLWALLIVLLLIVFAVGLGIYLQLGAATAVSAQATQPGMYASWLLTTVG
jgi:hypothetical protein